MELFTEIEEKNCSYMQPFTWTATFPLWRKSSPTAVQLLRLVRSSSVPYINIKYKSNRWTTSKGILHNPYTDNHLHDQPTLKSESYKCQTRTCATFLNVLSQEYTPQYSATSKSSYHTQYIYVCALCFKENVSWFVSEYFIFSVASCLSLRLLVEWCLFILLCGVCGHDGTR